ncbi:hypothetical protein, partial [Klebsiella pneumoniae]|uniref:hypothetical protein n=1 Tax=Klebsiella pneumoniae TaxID=573 RepID=UPI001BDFEBA6
MNEFGTLEDCFRTLRSLLRVLITAIDQNRSLFYIYLTYKSIKGDEEERHWDFGVSKATTSHSHEIGGLKRL